VVELDPSIAPETVNSFVFLAEQGYFDGTAAHRVLPAFVLQAGDPTATGRGGPGYSVPDELPPQGTTYERGVLAMANAGPGTSGSQFFIMLADAGLPPAYSIFGRVVDGLDVLDVIATLPLGDRSSGFSVERSVPLETLYIERVTVEG
jgi:cyclophilin family peptidyl-prolyl cis-trans isomerase